MVEGGRDLATGAALGIITEDAQHYSRLVTVNLVLAGPANDRPVAVRQPASALALRELASESAARLRCKVREVQCANQAPDTDRNLARATVVDGDKFTATETQHFPDLG
ncbi:MAG TPA: hypothetical protein VEN78_41205 [Bradyrhizobium sp.]|nr:hypothetical protein [Bradyrhizobium sp.]